MSSTNKTSNYELSQFLGSDKPAWLSDYNTDMSKIDTQMKANADAATAAAGSATTANTAIGTLANLTTTAKTSVVAAINEVDSNADTAQNTASTASSIASAASTKADNIETYITLNKKAKITASLEGGTAGNIDALYYAVNNNGTYGKVYGRYRFTKNTSGTATLTLSVPDMATVASSFTIEGACMIYALYNGAYTQMNFLPITVNTDKTITISFDSTVGNGHTVTLWLPPCIYYITDFGDQPSA